MRELQFRGKPLDYDPMTMPEWMTGFYHQELYGGRILHLITDGATTFEVDPDYNRREAEDLAKHLNEK